MNDVYEKSKGRGKAFWRGEQGWCQKFPDVEANVPDRGVHQGSQDDASFLHFLFEGRKHHVITYRKLETVYS